MEAISAEPQHLPRGGHTAAAAGSRADPGGRQEHRHRWGFRYLFVGLRCPARLRGGGGGGSGGGGCGDPCGAPLLPAAPPEAEQGNTSDSDSQEKICRYCFEGEEAGELISPCRCRGGQKYVHLSCLRWWQRTVLVSQPTHPDFYDVDTRQRICNVCKTEFTCPPPTRAELLASFTGAELAALIEEGCFIGSAEDFSREIEQQIGVFPEAIQASIVCRNWVRGIFLISRVVEDRNRGCVLVQLGDDQQRAAFMDHLDADGKGLHLRGRKYCVQPQGQLQHLAQDAPPAMWQEAMRSLTTPVTLKLRPELTDDCGEDAVVAVNLTRPFDIDARAPSVRSHQRLVLDATTRDVFGGVTAQDLPFQVTHFIGGPCEEEKVSACLVMADSTYTVVQDEGCLKEALEIARARWPKGGGGGEATEAMASASGGETFVGAEEELKTLAPGKREPPAPAREEGEEVCEAKRQKLEEPTARPRGGGDVRLYVFWGYAGWSRCQLMGEIAKGSWGLCKAAPEDVVLGRADTLWAAVHPRLMFAPKNEMSESYGGQEPEEEAIRQDLRRMAIFHQILRRHHSGGGRVRLLASARTSPAAVTGEEEEEVDDDEVCEDEEEEEEGEESSTSEEEDDGNEEDGQAGDDSDDKENDESEDLATTGAAHVFHGP